MSELEAGFAEVDYTPELGLPLRGQQYRRIAERKRDPLMVNAMALRSGAETLVMVSVDTCFLSTDFVTEIQRRFEEQAGLPGNRLLVHATHSHVAPTTVSYYWGEVDPSFAEKLTEDIVSTALAAVSRLEPVSAFSGAGELEYLGWPRRSMYADGTSQMHGHSRRPDYVGKEGPRDPTLSVLFTRNAEGRITGVALNFATHPNCVENDRFYSADLPGEVRRLLKQMLGPEMVVVYLTGAAGNTSPFRRAPESTEEPWMGEEGLKRSGLYMAGEAAKVIAAAIHPMDPASLSVEHTVLKIPIRPFAKPGERNYPDFWSDESKEYYLGLEADWSRRMRENSPVEVRLNVVRIGDTALCTNPGELFVEFGLQIRAASPARVTFVSELTDGSVGYVPTPLAFSRGGYETWPPSSPLVQEAGEQIVQATARLLEKAFEEVDK